MIPSVILLLTTFAAVTIGFNADFSLQGVTVLNNERGVELFKRFVSGQENVFFSPFSISTAMSMVYLGARNVTKRELGLYGYGILEALNVHLPATYQRLFQQLTNSDEYELDIGNALYTQADYPILDEYKDSLQTYYDALVKEVDFSTESQAAVVEINDWVNEKTRGKISKLVDELSPATRLVLLNAIYFKGTWQTQFEPEETKQLPFYNHGVTSTIVPTMSITSKFPYLDHAGRRLKALKLPYKGKHISMLLLLPYERNGIERLQRTIDSFDIEYFSEHLEETKVEVSIPKFKLEYSHTLNDDFRAAGVYSLFNSSADLSGITGRKDLYVSEILHKAVIEVNEEGSEAAAVTGIITKVMLPLPVLSNRFNADHPFLFYIIDDRTKLILFMGRVNELY